MNQERTDARRMARLTAVRARKARWWVPILFGALVLLGSSGLAEVRTWSARNGHRFDAEMMAADGLRVTLGRDGVPKWIVPISELVEADVELVQQWRKQRRIHPLVDPRLLAPWPTEASADGADVRFVGEETERFVFESTHFRMISDLKLPLPVARDLAVVFEATRNALMALPIGLSAGGEREKYSVLMTGSTEAYAEAGGGGGSGGFYEARTRRMLVLLPNLGIEQRDGKFQLQYAKNLFVLKHEVCHQLLARWHGPWPLWLHEGLPEVVASLPYLRGRYALQNPTAGLRDYLLKWRKGPNDRSVRVISPARIMAMEKEEWNRALTAGSAYDLYNTAGLLTHYFLQQGGGSAMAGYIEALRRGESAEEAEKVHLLPNRTRDSLTADLIALGRRIGVEVKIVE